jgi:hypothetical protein
MPDRFFRCFPGAQSSDIRKWFMKPQGKSAAASGAAGKPSGSAAEKKPVLSIPEKKSAPPALVGFCSVFVIVALLAVDLVLTY